MDLRSQLTQKIAKADDAAESMGRRVRQKRFELAEMERERQKSVIESQDMEDIVEESLREKKMMRQRFVQRQNSTEVCVISVFWVVVIVV